jgi:GABA(A) receptor-associated protein
MTFQFKKQHSEEKRLSESCRILAKYPDRIPIIVEKDPSGKIPDIDKNKFLVPGDLTVGQFLHVIRKRIKLQPEQALFIFINNVIPPTSNLLSIVYGIHKDPDGFLYCLYTGESVFGKL